MKNQFKILDLHEWICSVSLTYIFLNRAMSIIFVKRFAHFRDGTPVHFCNWPIAAIATPYFKEMWYSTPNSGILRNGDVLAICYVMKKGPQTEMPELCKLYPIKARMSAVHHDLNFKLLIIMPSTNYFEGHTCCLKWLIPRILKCRYHNLIGY